MERMSFLEKLDLKYRTEAADIHVRERVQAMRVHYGLVIEGKAERYDHTEMENDVMWLLSLLPDIA